MRSALLTLIASGLVLATAHPVFGHAIVRRTEPRIDQVVPRSPDRVVLVFSEPVEIAFGAIRVFDTLGQRVDAGPTDHVPGRADAIQAALRPGLPKGTYTVSWRVVSADGHPIAEAFVFHVQEPGQNPRGIADEILSGQEGAGRVESVLYGAVRWLNFAALLVLAGAVFFLAGVWRRTEATRSRHRDEVDTGFLARWGLLVRAAWIVAVAATLLSLVLQVAVAADLPLADSLSADLLAQLATTRFGIVSLVKVAILTTLAGIWLAARSRVRPDPARSLGAAAFRTSIPVPMLAVASLLSVALLATPGLAGHAGATPPMGLNLTADLLHVTAAATWLGGLVMLLVGAFPVTRALEADDRVRVLAPVVARFSDLAVVAMGALVISGLFRAWAEVRAFRGLTATYGLILLAKLAAFVPILALGAFNNRWTKPRLELAAREGGAGTGPLLILRRLVKAEVAAAAVVLFFTALLVNLPPARTEAGVVGPFVADVRLGQNNLNVLVDPNEVGENEVHLTAMRPSGSAVPIEEMRLLFRMPSEGIGPLVGQGIELAPGHFVVQGRQLSVAGEWTLEIVAHIGKFEEERATVTVYVNR